MSKSISILPFRKKDENLKKKRKKRLNLVGKMNYFSHYIDAWIEIIHIYQDTQR